MSSLPYLGGFIIGLGTGAYYFFGLLYTVRKVPESRNPGRLLIISYIMRICPVLIVMVMLARKDPGMFGTLLIGFFMVRIIMTRRINRLKEEATDAPQP